MKIADREIGPGHPVYIIAEAGLAHLGSLDLAMEMLHVAKEAGADAFKTQFWDAKHSASLYSGMRKANRCLSLSSIKALEIECRNLGIHFLCTPHDEYALKIVADLCPVIKIGSGERGNWNFISKAVDYGKPLILSLGGYELKDINALERIVPLPSTIALWLFCISKYPATWEDVKGQMPDFRNSIYDGWSSHTAEDFSVDLATIAAGAKIIEKHIKPNLDPKQEPESSMDFKASLSLRRFIYWCDEIRKVDGLFP